MLVWIFPLFPYQDFLVQKIKELEIQNSLCHSLPCFSIFPPCFTPVTVYHQRVVLLCSLKYNYLFDKWICSTIKSVLLLAKEWTRILTVGGKWVKVIFCFPPHMAPLIFKRYRYIGRFFSENKLFRVILEER